VSDHNDDGGSPMVSNDVQEPADPDENLPDIQASATTISNLLEMPADTLNTGLHLITANMYLPIFPIAIKYSLEGAIAEAISPLLLTYYAPFKGYVLAHRNARATEGEGSASRCNDQYGMSFLWVTVDVLVFRPVKGAWLKGIVGLQTESHIGLVVWNYFSARVEKKRLPPDWKFIEDEYKEPLEQTETRKGKGRLKRNTGAYHDGAGCKIEGELVFRAVDFDVTRTLMTIEGSLVNETEVRE
jgi:DNA-directed RNA polymerase I subunit RPA43